MRTALLFRFPFPGPWGKGLTEAAHELARDIADEYGLVWKIWLENCETGHAGGIYLFEHAAAAARYREKHERRLSAMGVTEVTATYLLGQYRAFGSDHGGGRPRSNPRIERCIDGRGAVLMTNPRLARAAPVIPHAIKGSRSCFRRP